MNVAVSLMDGLGLDGDRCIRVIPRQIARAMGANPTVISQWFDLLKKIQTEVGIVSPAQIWSGDETGVQNVPKEIKVLGIKNIRTFQQVSSEQGDIDHSLIC